ncbi:MAG: MarC family protein [Candidatus Methanofastidiosa archaeon]|jgi:multiple antibiotic resistance protein|nr:MarC family protein [Candidatus Methanofastidiosa archaeon]
MLGILLQLVILFFVVIDPLASFFVFYATSSHMVPKERQKTGVLAILIAVVLCFLVLILGQHLLELFSTTLDEFRIAGGIVLTILGIKMVLGEPLINRHEKKEDSARALASIIATPFITGPATIFTIIIASNDYGKLLTGIAVGIVLLMTVILFLLSNKVKRILGDTATQVATTILGLVTLSWGVKFVILGIKNIF